MSNLATFQRKAPLLSISGDLTVTASTSPLTVSNSSVNMQPASVEGMQACVLDIEGNLWIAGTPTSFGTMGALQNYNVIGDKFVYAGITIPLTDFTGGNRSVSGMGIDPDGNLWIGERFNATAYKYIFGAGTFVFSTSISVLGSTSLSMDSKGDMWTGDTGFIRKYNFGAGTYVYDGGGNDLDTTGQFAGSSDGSFLDAQGSLWVIESGIYFKYNFADPAFVYAGSDFDSNLLNIFSLGYGNGFIGTENNIWVVDLSSTQGPEAGRRNIYKLFTNHTQLSLNKIGVLAGIGTQLELPDATVVRCTDVIDDNTILVSDIVAPGLLQGATKIIIEDEDSPLVNSNGEVILRKPEITLSLPDFIDTRIQIAGAGTIEVIEYTIVNMPPGNYYALLSYDWSLNATDESFVTEFSINGVFQGTSSEIHRQEPQDSGGNDGDGRGTDQKFGFSQQYYFQVESVQDVPLVLDMLDLSGDDPAMWNMVCRIFEDKK